MSLLGKAPQPLCLPSYPCSRWPSPYLRQVQPAPTSGPLHMTASLPELTRFLTEPHFLLHFLQVLYNSRLSKRPPLDHPISSNTSYPNHMQLISLTLLCFSHSVSKHQKHYIHTCSFCVFCVRIEASWHQGLSSLFLCTVLRTVPSTYTVGTQWILAMN